MIALLWSLLVFGALAALAAWAAEQARWLLGASRRLPWLVALLATAAWPLIQTTVGHLIASSPAMVAIQLPPLVIATQTANAVSGTKPWLAAGLVIIWGVASFVMLVRLVLAARAATTALRTGEPSVIDGAPVVLSDRVGPAVVGWVRPHVLWPRWLSDIDPSLRRLILKHEREHCRAHDPRWVLAAECAVVLMPWHPAIWWMRTRLRAAIELDCDARVLSGDRDAPRYGKLLMLLAQRQPSMRLASMLAEPRSLLSRRILTMTTPRPRHSRLRAAVLSLAALAVIVTACSTALNRAGMAPAAREARSSTRAVQATSPAPAYFEFQIDEPVQQGSGSTRPAYPPAEKAAGIEGMVLAQFIVGPDGVVEAGSFRVLSGTVVGNDGKKQAVVKPESDFGPFDVAVRDAMATARYAPGKLRGVKVRQLVQQRFVFALATK